MGDRKPGRSRRDSILDSATRLMTERGFDGTPVSAIGERLGLSKAAITYYFPTKDALAVEITGHYFSALDNALDRAGLSDSGWPHEARATCRAFLDTAVEHLRVARWVDRDLALENIDAVSNRRTAIIERLVETISGGSDDAADRARAFAVVGGLVRPLREMSARELRAQRDVIVDAALVSYQPIT